MVINPGGGWGCRSRGRLHTMHGTASGSETHLRQARERPSGNDPLGRAENSGIEAVEVSYHKNIHRRSGAMSFHQVLLQHKGWGNGVSVWLQGPSFPLGEFWLDDQGTSKPKHTCTRAPESHRRIEEASAFLAK